MGTAHESFWRLRLRRTLAGNGAAPVLVLLEGPAGTGKSRLAEELTGLTEGTGAVCLRWSPGEAGTVPEPAEQAGDRPVLLIVDDVHRADPEELRKLHRLLEQPRPGLAAVITYRPEELAAPGLPLGAPPPGYPPALAVLRHRIRPWTEAEVRQAATAALGDRCTAEAVARLHERSGGVAQVVVDLLTVLRDSTRQRCTAADVDAAGVPVRLADLSLGRTAALPPEHRPIVWAAAALGEPVTRDELVAVSGLGQALGREALLGALAGAALTESGEGRYGLPVPLAAVAVHGSVPGPVRQELHGRAADVLARRQPVPWTALARHHHAGGRVRGWLRAVEHAAREAAEASRHQDAIHLLEQTLASPSVPPQTRARLAPLLARSAVLGLRSDQTVEVLGQIVEDQALPATVRGELRLDLGLLLCNQVGMSGQGWRELERAAAELRDARPDLSARAMSALAMPYWPGSSIDVHRAWLEGAAEAAADSGDEAVRTAVAANRAGLAMSCGDPTAWELVRALPTDNPDPRTRQHAARGLCNAADSAVWLGYHERAEELLTEGLELSAKSGSPYTQHTALGARLLLEWFTGRWAGLAERCETFVTATSDMPVICADARMVRGLLALAQGEWGNALAWLSGPDGPSPEHAAPPLAAATSGALIRLALARQELPAAAAEARKAWAGMAAKGVWVWAAELAPWAVEAMARAGDRAAAQAMVDDFAAGLTGRDSPAASAALTWSRAVLAETDGRAAEAVPLYRRAAADYAALPRPYAHSLTTESAARCALSAGAAESAVDCADGTAPEGSSKAGTDGSNGTDVCGVAGAEEEATVPRPRDADDFKTQAVAELTACAQQFSDLGAVWDAARARALLRSHQPAREVRPPGRPSYGDQLSPREREVAELAATGLTNREIATTLHLSPRTVEQHVARAMRKLGTQSRQDLAETRAVYSAASMPQTPTNGTNHRSARG
ncbi:helix-turn-helix transcriptional regulator [Streptomyces sp. Tu 2975]|uniref:helix-turn-helix transcriptional regulator n=1 Tax=Streptomyces sp. Tu 2975 TaxID=2676871 RepID=UPI001357D325|nr:LuxR C-terminal-related transcriptional regulator [Streptomyces sp. Tu 2975]QIP85698.1 helix-turn-helix transcriptional regulator [Streptomyces sp. Tu 2975]